MWVCQEKVKHKAGCAAIRAQPAFMQETARRFVKDHRSNTRVEVQGHADMRALSGNAFGQDRLHKVLQRNRDGCRKVVNLHSLESMVNASIEKCVVDKDVSMAYRSWDGAADPYDPVDVSKGDWDANAVTPSAIPEGEADVKEEARDIVPKFMVDVDAESDVVDVDTDTADDAAPVKKEDEPKKLSAPVKGPPRVSHAKF